ncbi:nSTAND3 domain-containing NTPase [Caulobacter hibisci]|uniref:Novel STAND NTPase 3 domain-containing protein n=1 Tax=Caulobacter hibisci TaxID=2035993 RepID=A0ABS0T0Q6_9CAUL|nr:hypothetical protein [Caulobacter hibisci]MBI1685389.1 hypothetical protein [Caulobacter hibisci]
MSIALVAPKKFTFQDLVCVELGLRCKDAALLAEPTGGEDAQLDWNGAGLCEVQVKGAAGDVSAATLAEHLLHFPPHAAVNPLFDRLRDDPTRSALFVFSGRCDDELKPLLAPMDWQGGARGQAVDEKIGASLCAAFKALATKRKAGTTPSKLAQKRSKRVAELAALTAADCTGVLQRVFLHELQSSETIDVIVQKRLLAQGVPTDRLADGVSRLAKIVADGKGLDIDLNPTLHDLLATFGPELVAKSGYLPRGEDASMLEELSRLGAILLSGPPRVGKSWTAFQLAGELQKLGFEVQRSSHIDQADRFLNEPVRRQRAYVLEDPLGPRQAVADSSVRLVALQKLLDGLGDDRRLIVAQSQEPLLETRRAGALAQCAVGAWQWRALGALPLEDAQALWRRDAAEAQVEPVLIERISKLIAETEALRDAGAIAYLAATIDRIEGVPTDAELLAASRADAVDFAHALAQADAPTGDVLKACAIATEPGRDAQLREVAFILGGAKERPSLRSDCGIDVMKPAPIVAPVYEKDPLAQGGLDSPILSLRRRRVLERHGDQLNFVHPYVRAGAQALLRPEFDDELELAAGQVERALAAVDRDASLSAARNLDWILGAFKGAAGGYDRTLDLAETGLRSLYPATRDACFDFLSRSVLSAASEKKTSISHWVSSVDLDFEQLVAVDGQLIVCQGLEAFFHSSDPPKVADVAPYVDAIRTGEVIDLDAETSKLILDAYRSSTEDLPAEIVARLLAANEAAIRAETVRLALTSSEANGALLLSKIADDFAPAITKTIFLHVCREWDSLEKGDRESFLEVLDRHAHAMGGATILLSLLSQFRADDHFDELDDWASSPRWEVLSRLAPVAIRNAPNVIFRDGRLVGAIEEAAAAGEGLRLKPLLDSWVEKLQARLADRIPDENELSVIDLLVRSDDKAWRWPHVASLLQAQNTAARIYFTARLASAWSKLTPDEQQRFLDVVGASVGDERWLVAACLTRRDVASDLVERLTGDRDLLSRSPEELLAHLGAPVFQACIHLMVGAPQPLWWIGQHHQGGRAWAQAVEWVAGDLRRPGFAVALDDLANEERSSELLKVVESVDRETLVAISRVLLSRRLGEVGNWQAEAWARLLERAEAFGDLETVIEAIVEVAPNALEDLREIREWFGTTTYADRVLGSFVEDLKALQFMWGLIKARKMLAPPTVGFGSLGYDDDLETETSVALNAIRRVADAFRDTSEKPKLFGTWQRLGEGFRTIGASVETLKWIEDERRKAIDRRFASRSPEGEDASVFADWKGPL